MLALRILIVFLGLTIPAFSQNIPHLVIYFDVNETLTATDKAGNKTTDNILNELLARKYSACWDESVHEPITFEKYVNEVLLPDTSTENFSAQRRQQNRHFIDYLRVHSHPLYGTVLANYNTSLAVVETSNNLIFPSFFHLVDDLKQQQVSYTIILRSFGSEIMEVKDEIEKIYPSFFANTGKFRSGHLHLENNDPVTDAFTIYQQLRRIEHSAIHDDYHYWFNHGMSASKGKPFYIHRADKETLCIFFDDNIRDDDSSNIVAALDAMTGEPISVKELLETRQLVRVNTLEAISDVEYYKKHVQEALNRRQ